MAIAGWLRYLLAVDDEGNTFELSPDPMNEELQRQLAGIMVGVPSTLTEQAKGILSNENIFGIDLYKAGIGNKIEEMFCAQIEGSGAVRRVVKKYLG